MPGFAESFWSDDLVNGLTTLFTKLNQGIIENEEVLGLAKRRAEHEEYHGNKLLQVARDSYRKDGFKRDDGASLRRAFEGMVKETEESAKCHLKIATNLQNMVIRPFGKWTQEHAIRVQSSEKELLTKVKEREKQTTVVKKLRSTYFNKCRVLEDFEEENKLAFPGRDGAGTPTQSPKKTSEELAADLNSVLDDEPIELGEVFYSAAQLKVLLESLLAAIVMKEVKVPILGTFEHVSTGSAIVRCIQECMGVTSLGDAETIGQDMVNNGLIRYLGVGNTFANSSVLNYQWKDKSLLAAGKIKAGPSGIASRAASMPYVGDYVSTYVTHEFANETPRQRLVREASQANDIYRDGVSKLDELRTDVEGSIMQHLQFMERCELDRLKALKAVMMDISAAISNVIPGMKSSMDTMLLFQESVSPIGDLKYMIDSYRSGNFNPKVVVYENYYNSVDDQTFGVDLELRARQDRKRVPNVVSAILSYMDENYPNFDTDEARQKTWLREVPLHLTHQLRALINNGKTIDKHVLAEFDPAIVAAVLKLYLLELPDSLIFKTLYEPLKSIYLNYGSEDDSGDRISAVCNVLQQLKVSNIATLDALTIHFGRLLDLTNADELYKSHLARVLGRCVVRPKVESGLTHQDKHPQRLILDLIDYRKDIFTSLKRVSTTRPRSATDEKDRKGRTEERNRAISQAGKRSGLQTSTLPPSTLKYDSAPTESSSEMSARVSVNSSQGRDSTPAEFVQPEDEPFHYPAESEMNLRRVSLFNTSDLEQTSIKAQAVTTLPTPAKTPSLSRAVASGHRLSRHSRQESRNITQTADSSTPSSEFRSSQQIAMSEAPARQVDDVNINPVRGVSLEDGDIDYD